ncbi:MAG: hypothetical protein F4Y79_00250 [Gemmatimonadetes bacterium]|nr:hypothetical protein [Gemmatimonadota bacterium]
MNLDNNPFKYDAANNLTDKMIADYYIDDFNYSRFIQSKRNIFLVGERGSGKTMALLFNSWRIQKLLAEKREEEPSLSTIGIYIPCNTPLIQKAEYQLLDDEFLGSVLSEHFLVLSIAQVLTETLAEIPHVLDGADESLLRSETNFVLGSELPEKTSFFDAIKLFLQRELLTTQRTINSGKRATFYENTFSFASVFIPILNMCANKIPQLKDSHFLFMLDDAQALNEHQVRAMNSWIAYRDHSLFSFKVAVAKVGTPTKITSSGGSILEGHDYTTIDLEASLQNKKTDFYQLAERIVKRRLKNISVSASPKEFFPVSTSMEKDLKASEKAVREEAIRKFGEANKNPKAVTDYIYKYKRAHYFKSRSSKANRPPYSGFETLVFLSTGVIRNLIEPCFWMFDSVVSEATKMKDEQGSEIISCIPPAIQTKVILERSRRTWDWVRNSIANDIEDCSMEDGLRAFQLLDALAVHFRYRLLNYLAEPRALSFTISKRDQDIMDELNHLIEILQKAQLLYVRSGPAKSEGRRETYYVPNRILWPDRGLDPHGQHARVSIPSDILWTAAKTGKIDLKYLPKDKQMELWNAEQ